MKNVMSLFAVCLVLLAFSAKSFAGDVCQTRTSAPAVGIVYADPNPNFGFGNGGHCGNVGAGNGYGVTGVRFGVAYTSQGFGAGNGYNQSFGFQNQNRFRANNRFGNGFGNTGNGQAEIRSSGLARILGTGGPDVSVNGSSVEVRPTGFARLLGLGGNDVKINR